jgi:hypothetical protein
MIYKRKDKNISILLMCISIIIIIMMDLKASSKDVRFLRRSVKKLFMSCIASIARYSFSSMTSARASLKLSYEI